MKRSAGLLPFRRGSLEVLIAHPGGPVWARRHEGAWSVIKGEIEDGEDGFTAAQREFTEETGWPAPAGPYEDLGHTVLKSGKHIQAWSVEAPDLDPASLAAPLIEVTIRGQIARFPEIDEVRWMVPEQAKVLLNPAQAVFVERLVAMEG